LIVGNSRGELYRLKKSGSNGSWAKNLLNISVLSFAAPTFIETGKPDIKDMVISDGNGQLIYFRNNNNNYMLWEESSDFFSERIFTGPASAPAISEVSHMSYMVVGSRNGELNFFEHDLSSYGLPWVEIPYYFRKLKTPGYSRGIITKFQERELLITGQQDGIIKAFFNFGTIKHPLWTEQKRFFRTLPKIPHAAPSAFDINGDGRWELIVGDAKGYVKGYRYEITEDGNIIWEEIDTSFNYVKVGRYASPALFRDSDKIYLLVGQQDGKIMTFMADTTTSGFPVFFKNGYLEDIHVNNHSSPSVVLKEGLLSISVGDYNGNLKQAHLQLFSKKDCSQYPLETITATLSISPVQKK
jgi:outer membrane protein assembly factor BamB